jgi:hypothetical protein
MRLKGAVMLPTNNDVILVSEWGSDKFHRRVLELGEKGYLPRQGSYNVTPETNPENGIIIHLHTMEMFMPESEVPAKAE